MQYEMELDAAELIEERRQQWHVLGITDAIMDSVGARVTDMWNSGSGCWATEWSREAQRAADEGNHALAVALYGAAKFPVLGSPAHAEAYRAQVAEFLEHAPQTQDTVVFERITLLADIGGMAVEVAAHAYGEPGLNADAPIVLVFSGVDTWKIEIDDVARSAARIIGARVLTIDMPGTGEALVANSMHGERYVEAVLAAYREYWPAARKVAAFGFSFAGHWTIKLALMQRVDAAVSIGGMIDDALQEPNVRALRFGMKGIWGNSLRPEAPLDDETLVKEMAKFSLRSQGLLEDGARSAPLLFINGDRDQHSTPTDVDPLRSIPGATVRLIPEATHCAAEHLGTVIPEALLWLRRTLAGE
ncbi:esterase FrsA [Curtobacterium sp. UNCCL20]|uniref:alpha/beta hydrolase n=1 Tax=Curtobacterium sp. UNCCL20 TaxID=1502773 RepID=UPI000888EE4C|nr:alpha/beta hydrolase [Curtobacterium sp. UNCCL20]SDQ13316.1 esterase FrsA [Curtobacterium sp. UNCCL20]